MKYIKLYEGLEQYDDRVISRIQLQFHELIKTKNPDLPVDNLHKQIREFLHSEDFAYVFNIFVVRELGGYSSRIDEHPYEKISREVKLFFESEYYADLCEKYANCWIGMNLL